MVGHVKKTLIHDHLDRCLREAVRLQDDEQRPIDDFLRLTNYP